MRHFCSSIPTERSEYQGLLESILHSVFPDKNILTNVRKEVNVRSVETGLPLEIDAWIPDLKLAFEYQDPHHYTNFWYSNVASLERVQKKDDMKKRLMTQRGDTLITIPCWWDGSSNSLIATIQAERPDLLQAVKLESSDIIPPNPPDGYFDKMVIPNVGELMQPLFFPASSFDHSSWWMSEKYDGFRFCWNPLQKSMFSRFGARNEIVSEKLSLFLPPDTYLDGEIWFGRETFEDSHTIMRRDKEKDKERDKERDKNETIKWEDIRFVVFDCPDPLSLSLSHPYELRFSSLLLNYVSIDGPIIPATNKSCKNKQHLKIFTKLILSNGGEGSIIRLPKSLYFHGKSNFMFKVKSHRDDEALVLHVADNGQYTLQLTDGTVFTISDSDTDNTREHRVKAQKGDIVNFSFVSLSTNKIPHGVRLLRIRKDITWEEAVFRARALVVNEKHENKLAQLIKDMRPKQKPSGHWTGNKERENVRNYFDSFAFSNSRNPLDVETWYSFKPKDYYTGLASITRVHGSLPNALKYAYPELNFNEDNFIRKKNNFWTDIINVRNFLDGFAETHNFDPLVPNNWYSLTLELLQNYKGGYSLLNKYGVYSRAIMDAYPEIGLDPRKFRGAIVYVASKESKKAVFDSIAARLGFDPLSAKHWHCLSCTDIMKHPGGASVMRQYNGALTKALKDIYPNIGIDPLKFKKVAIGYWNDKYNRKRFVDTFAKNHLFDPQVADNWYSVTYKELLMYKGAAALMKKCKTIAGMVKSVYPNCPIEESGFAKASVGYWGVMQNRADVFLKFASKHNFDPLVASNWYNVQPDVFTHEKGGGTVLRYYKNSFVNAVMSLFPNIGLERNKFDILPHYHWRNIVNRRAFFDRLANRLNFDPLVSSNWYSVKSKNIIAELGGAQLMKLHRGVWRKALISTYTDMHFDESKFSTKVKKKASYGVQ